MDSSIPLLYSSSTNLSIRFSGSETSGSVLRISRTVRRSFNVDDSPALQLRIPVSIDEILVEPAEDQRDCLGFSGGSSGAYRSELVVSVSASDGSDRNGGHFEYFLGVLVFGLLDYTVFGGCPLTWTGFSIEAFSGLWEFLKLSAASSVMLCLENWYHRIPIVMTRNLKNAKIAVDALSICMTINGWEMMIPVAFFAATGVRVSNELGAGNGKRAKFATAVSMATSMFIGAIFWALIVIFHEELALIFSSSKPVLEEVNKLSILLAFTILLNKPLSGCRIGWESCVAYINLCCYYLVGVTLGLIMGCVFNRGVMGIWAGMILGGTVVQTLILAIITVRCDWEKEAEKASK